MPSTSTRLDIEAASAHLRALDTSPFEQAAAPLLEHGYSPVRQIGQRCIDRNWQTRSTTPHTVDELKGLAHSPMVYNVGIALAFNSVVQIDRDTDNAAVCEALRPTFAAIYGRGGTPVAKYGSKGCSSILRFVGDAWRNRTYVGIGRQPIIELSGAGRASTLPPSIHPKTSNPYRWLTKCTLLDTRPDELPVLIPDDIEAIERALAPFMPPPKPMGPYRSTMTGSELTEAQRRRHESYASAVLDRECVELAAMQPDTGRNWKAYRVACRVGTWVHHRILPERHVIDQVLSACTLNRLVADTSRGAVLGSIRSGLDRSANDALTDLSQQRGRR